MALYLLDWDANNARSQTVEVIDPATNAVLDTRRVSAFGAGVYLVWELSGNVRLRLTNAGAPSPNAVVSGVSSTRPRRAARASTSGRRSSRRYKDFDQNIVEKRRQAQRQRGRDGDDVQPRRPPLRHRPFRLAEPGPGRPEQTRRQQPRAEDRPHRTPNLTPTPQHLTPHEVHYIESTLPYEQR